jgi:tetratricopeptide (TPR) repeat protein
LVVVLLLVTLPFALLQVAKFIKYKTFLYASNAYDAKEYEISEVYFSQVYRILKYESIFSLKYAECLYENKKYGEALDVLKNVKEIVPDPELFLLIGKTYMKLEKNSEAKQCFEEAAYMVPGRILPKYYLTKLYYDIEEKSKADSIAEIILKMNIKINSDTTKALVNEIKAIYQNN